LGGKNTRNCHLWDFALSILAGLGSFYTIFNLDIQIIAPNGAFLLQRLFIGIMEQQNHFIYAWRNSF
jgi:hypothetical protein